MCSLHDELDDDIGDIFADMGIEKPASGVLSSPVVAAKPDITQALHYEPCRKCGGTGRFARGYSFSGPCFTCKGKGKLAFKTDAATRAANRASAARRKEEAATSNVATFAHEHAAEVEWMKAASARGFQFAANMLEAIGKYGSLTERQMETVERLMVQDAERDERRAQEAKERAEREANAKAVDITRIVASMEQAISKGTKRPILRLDTFRFSRASSGQNGGALYVRDAADTERYLGKIVDGRFIRTRECSTEEEVRIIAAAADPEASAHIYGKRTGTCSCCGLELTNHESIELGIGPICRSKFF